MHTQHWEKKKTKKCMKMEDYRNEEERENEYNKSSYKLVGGC